MIKELSPVTSRRKADNKSAQPFPFPTSVCQVRTTCIKQAAKIERREQKFKVQCLRGKSGDFLGELFSRSGDGD